MPEMPDVIATEPVESDWGNDIRDRTVQRYADAAARDAGVPFPVAGDLAWLDTEAAVTVFDGSAWLTLGVAVDPGVPRLVQVNRRQIATASFSADQSVSQVVDVSGMGIVNTNRCTVTLIGSATNQQSQRAVWAYSSFSSSEITVHTTGGSSQTNNGGAFGQLVITEYDRQIN